MVYSANAFENSGLSKLEPAPLSVSVWPLPACDEAADVGAAAGAVVGLDAAVGGLVGLAAGAVVGIGVLADVQPANSRTPHTALARRRRDIPFVLPGAFLQNPIVWLRIVDSIRLTVRQDVLTESEPALTEVGWIVNR